MHEDKTIVEGETIAPRSRIGAGLEAAGVYAARRVVVPALEAAARHLSIALPQLPVARTAYVGFLFTVAVGAWTVARGESLARFGLRRSNGLWRTAGVALAAMAACVAYSTLVAPLVDPYLGPDRATESFAAVEGNAALLLTVLPFIWLFAALGEEFLYRGFLMTRLASAFGGGRAAWVYAVVLQAVLFGAAHAYQGGPGAVGTAVYGLAFGVATRAGGSLWPAIVAHGLLDTLGFLLLYLGALA